MVYFHYKKTDSQVEVLDPIAEHFLPLLAKTDSCNLPPHQRSLVILYRLSSYIALSSYILLWLDRLIDVRLKDC